MQNHRSTLGAPTRTIISITGVEDRIMPDSVKASIVAKDGTVKSTLSLLRLSGKSSYETTILLSDSGEYRIKLTGDFSAITLLNHFRTKYCLVNEPKNDFEGSILPTNW